MKSKLILAGAIAAIAVPNYIANAQTEPKPAPVPTFKSEKCYGIAKAGNNDCQTMSSSCAGTSKRDRQADAWIYVPEGICGKVAGGVVKAKRG